MVSSACEIGLAAQPTPGNRAGEGRAARRASAPALISNRGPILGHSSYFWAPLGPSTMSLLFSQISAGSLIGKSITPRAAAGLLTWGTPTDTAPWGGSQIYPASRNDLQQQLWHHPFPLPGGKAGLSSGRHPGLVLPGTKLTKERACRARWWQLRVAKPSCPTWWLFGG